MIDNLILGFGTAITFDNLLYCFYGVLLGTAIGVLPGLGPVATISILIPLTLHIGDPVTALIMLAGIYYGAMYGGSITAILMNIPGEISSVVTTLDGHQMARQGKAGSALMVSAVGSFVGGSISTLFVFLISIPMVTIALKFGPVEFTSLCLLGLIGSIFLTKEDQLRGISMILLGAILSLIGIDRQTGVERLTFGSDFLLNGVTFSVLAVGICGLGEIIYNVLHKNELIVQSKKLKITFSDVRRSLPSIMRGTAIGTFIGLLPGVGTVLSSITSYITEKKLAKNPNHFGRGAIQGVAGPESANNASVQTQFVPMLTLGVPLTPVMALMLATMMIHNVEPGPQVIQSNPAMFWGLIASFWIGNLMLLFLNINCVKLWVKFLEIKRQWLYLFIVVVCVFGVYKINNNVDDVFLLLLPSALLGYLLKKWHCEPAPLLMGFVIGGLMEKFLIRSLHIHNGDWMVFIREPISVSILFLCAVIVIGKFVFNLHNKVSK